MVILKKRYQKIFVLTTFVEAKLYHGLTTGRARAAILDVVNQTPMNWYTKQQPTVDTTT